VKKIIITLFFFLFAVPCLAESKVLINEFLIDPQPQQMEIINTSTEEADISGWYIDDSGGTTYYTIPQLTILYPNSCLVFSDDFNLNKSSADTVRLFTNNAPPTSQNATLIDSYSYKTSPGTNISFLRLPDGDQWTTGSATLGLFNQSKFSCIVNPSPTATLTPTPISTITPTIINQAPTGAWPTEIPILTLTPIPQSYDNIYISEAMVYPQSGNNEWIEIFNNNDYSVSLNNWFIDDIENGGSTPKSFSADIPAKSYYVFNLSSSMFNNGGDSVRLLDNNKNLKDSFEYAGGDQGKTFGRTSLDNDDFCPQEPSSGAANNSCINPIPTMIISGQINSSPTIPNKPISINQPARRNLDEGGLIDTKKSIVPTITTEPGKVLGASNKSLVNFSSNNKSLVNTLLFISCSYSLLTMFSILIKIRSIYEKIGRLLSSFVYPS